MKKSLRVAMLQTEVAQAWLERRMQEQRWLLLQAQITEARVLVQTTEAALRGGRGSTADALSAREALAQLKDLPLADMPFGLCLFEPDWHQGVIGILASRLKERYFRPAIAFADAGDGLLKGSARSVPGLHIRDALDAVAAKHPGLISKFGGHAMAAGLSLPLVDLLVLQLLMQFICTVFQIIQSLKME